MFWALNFWEASRKSWLCERNFHDLQHQYGGFVFGQRRQQMVGRGHHGQRAHQHHLPHQPLFRRPVGDDDGDDPECGAELLQPHLGQHPQRHRSHPKSGRLLDHDCQLPHRDAHLGGYRRQHHRCNNTEHLANEFRQLPYRHHRCGDLHHAQWFVFDGWEHHLGIGASGYRSWRQPQPEFFIGHSRYFGLVSA